MPETTQTMADRATDGLLRTFRYCLKYLPGAYERIGTGGVHLVNFTVPVSELTACSCSAPNPIWPRSPRSPRRQPGSKGPGRSSRAWNRASGSATSRTDTA
ncbi:MAG TPA: hypothetical protein VHZ97_00180 [Pseudonocardiaceae bacterium]|nr:hypothetical protein [Pseudonocardiaceae bacterium]